MISSPEAAGMQVNAPGLLQGVPRCSYWPANEKAGTGKQDQAGQLRQFEPGASCGPRASFKLPSLDAPEPAEGPRGSQ